MHVVPARSLAAAAAAAGLLVPLLALPGPAVAADEAPGAPGADATWRSGDKDGVGTSLSRTSKVWYTLADGTLSETYYPAADTPNVRDLQFAVSDGTNSQLETDDSVVRTAELADPTSLTYRQTSTDKAGRWRLTKTYVTDPQRSTLMISVDFEALEAGPYELFTLYDPSLAGTSTHDSGSTAGGALVATDTHLADRPIASALVASTGFTATSTGYVGTSDGWADLADGRLDTTYATAGPGNIAQTGQVPVSGAKTSFTLAVGFGADAAEATATARSSLDRGYAATASAYQREWSGYLDSLKKAPKNLRDELRTQYDVSVMTVKAHEDKTYPGAFIASLTLPWGQAVNADGAGGGGAGYHFVWARDLYHQVTSLLAAGDTAAANRAVTWLFTRQQLPDGRFPQNSHVDGSPDQNNVQLDETAFPIVLAWQVGRTGGAFYRDHIKKAADFLVASGPRTPQERWETEDGYSPSTMASQIAGLTAAADIARRNGDDASAAVYQGTADDWQRKTEKWMYTTTGPVGDGKYYIRIEGDGDPDDGDSREYSDAAGVHEERAVLDAGFLELVRLGVKAPDDPYVVGSIAETDRSLATDTPSGRMWHRYTYDGYGERADGSPWTLATGGIGRLWPLLSGERGEYELANGRNALAHLRTMHRSANAGYMIPEQAWDRPEPTSYGHELGKGTGSAGPLAWAMAQYVRLARGIANGGPVETPKVTSRRYVSGRRLTPPALTVTSPEPGVQLADGDSIRLTGSTDGRAVYVGVNGQNRRLALERGRRGTSTFDVVIEVPDLRNQLVVVAEGKRGATSTVTRTVLSYGNRIGSLADPAGDDDGPGTYVYPANAVYKPGTFDLTGTDVYDRGDQVAVVTGIAGAIENPFGGDQISHQRINVYLGSGSGAAVPALPGTNLNTASPWSRVVVTDGRFSSAGVFGGDGARVGDVSLVAIPETHQVVTLVDKADLGGLDLSTASYGVAMFGNAEAGEGIGFVRPVYDYDYWNSNALGFVRDWRFGGGAGEIDFNLPSKDTDIRDPNAIDITVGVGQTQEQVMDWQSASPVALPMIPLQ
ncbi:glucan 1,4-alpha-glucosidase [Nocardioides sp. zg-1230]|uniref:glucan 1,4-alpha-glucosidase n=1 Tax=Nocardioides sp. zg-1230 TaxID=2736601 RepID=UPI0015547440|nr:glucan 1,4-alpha-glucosidase [Nocardioides sp. zg-1230]NPC41665.1 glucan 1,4-alpha-glucosidase [Nocardioides sp. zg-1230]